jgi:hypothetical protein
MGWRWNHITVAALTPSYDPEHRQTLWFVRVQKAKKGHDKWSGLYGGRSIALQHMQRRVSGTVMATWNHALSGAVVVRDGNTPRGHREPGTLDDGTRTRRVPQYRCALQWRWGLNSNYRPGRGSFKFGNLKCIKKCTVHRGRQRVRNWNSVQCIEAGSKGIQRETAVSSRRTNMKGCCIATVPGTRHRLLSGGDPLARVLTGWRYQCLWALLLIT